MNQAQIALRVLLRSLDINVPNSEVTRLLDTPLGTSLRGISDALDSLSIENNVYQLPKEYLNELEYPYLMVLPHSMNSFVVVTNEEEKEAAIPEWEGVVLTATKTSNTPIYKYVWLHNAVNHIANYQIYFIIAILTIVCLINTQSELDMACHTILAGVGAWLSTLLLIKNNRGVFGGRYCKLGKIVDCEHVLKSKGSRLLGFLRMSDLAFLFFVTQLSLELIGGDSWRGYSLLLLLVGCCFTLYSVVYQIAVIRKICLYCMSINLIVWLDTIIFVFNNSTINLHKPFLFLLSGTVSYIIWYLATGYLSLSGENYSLKNKNSILYDRDLFDWLLSKERGVDDIDNKYADIDGKVDGDVITMFVHPKCKNCKNIYRYIPELRKRAVVKTVSLASNDKGLHDYCSKNQIVKTPTIVFNGRELPEIYSVEDLKYLL